MATVLKTTDVRCRIEEDLKERATAVLQSCGLSVSDAMRLFLRQVVATQGLPFEVRVPSEKTARALVQAREIRRQFYSIEEMVEDLDGEAGEDAHVEAGRTAKKRRVHP
ncbi:type II toxin-antitoxin system RelB/DinJ family antitoxin [Pseudomonas alabamensis]|uniref:type II toxin-antitoxin system RelB/DinJ family antitoxin n=1 Tax=Pseudomonas alabamensis TaxID=3064349 RepID=UPI003F64EC8A